jgi:flagellar motility protein MotE (MotC chaperone)
MNGKNLFFGVGFFLTISGAIHFQGLTAEAQDDLSKTIEQKRQELAEKEGRLKKEEERVKTIQKEVEAKILKWNQLLAQIEEALKKWEDSRSERMGHLVKTFEAMPPEEASIRLASLEKPLAMQIIFKMNTKKAGAVLALMDPKQVAELTEGIAKSEKKIPTK